MKYLKLFYLFEAKLPESYYDSNIIGNMKIGEVGYTVPWAMKVDNDNECWLDMNFNVYEQKSGTVELKIKRIEDGFIAYINELKDTKYRTEKLDKSQMLEVVAFDDNYHSNVENIEDLKHQLSKAIENEDYRKAASIQDKIKKINEISK